MAVQDVSKVTVGGYHSLVKASFSELLCVKGQNWDIGDQIL